MKIGVDIRFLAKGTRTGIEEYALNLLSRLLSLDKQNEYKLFYNAFHKVELDYGWLKFPNVELKEFHLPNRFIFDPLAKIFQQPKIDRLLGGVDVFFAPHFLLSPVSRNCRQVIVFHDLSFEYFPEFFPWRKRFWHASLNPRVRALGADKIIAVSQSTRDDLVDIYGVSKSKIKVIYSGVSEEFVKLSPSDGRREQVKQRYRLPDNFILYFGTLEPRKNIVGLIKAYDIFRSENKKNNQALVIAGQTGWLFEEIFQTAKSSPFKHDIVFTGFVQPEDKVALYNLSSLFVYPSFFEGFGFPPLEAMGCGVPTITGNASSFPEVVGEAALMVDSYNLNDLAWAMNEILNDKNLADYLVEKGSAQVKKFSWRKCANETLDFLTS